MTASYRNASYSTVQTGTSGSMSMTVPTGTLAGELEFVAIYAYTSSSGTFALTVTPPAGQGWTVVAEQATAFTPNVAVSLWKRLAPASNSTQVFTWSATGSVSGARSARVTFTGANVVGGIEGVASAGGASPVTVTSTMAAPDLLVAFLAGNVGSWTTPPSGWTYRTNASGLLLADRSPGAPGTYSVTSSGGGTVAAGIMFGILPPNSAPNAPNPSTPATGSTIDLASVNRFGWVFSDPDPTDSQSKFDLQYRVVGAPSWTTVTQATPNGYWDAPAGTFTAGDYEWQVRTYDSQGVVGPYCASSFFTAAAAPAIPTITAPVNGAAVAVSQPVTWSAPNQDSYQLRRVADNAGTINTGTVYFDTGEVVDATTRNLTVAFPTNNRWEWLQVRVKDGGLWSPWASIRVQVSWTPPPVPTVSWVAVPADGAIDVTISNPAPGAGEPAVAYNDVYFAEPGEVVKRRATLVPPNSTWRHWGPTSAPASYTYTVTAVADNGTTSSSEATS